MRAIIWPMCVILGLVCGGARAQILSTFMGGAEVVDGDTLKVRGLWIRLHGIDAPEIDQLCETAAGTPWGCGVAAATHLQEIIGGLMVTCEGIEADRYDRMVATCHVDGRDLSASMIGGGWALAYRRHLGPGDQRYITLERMAKVSSAGIWSGTFTPPWEWRLEGGRPEREP